MSAQSLDGQKAFDHGLNEKPPIFEDRKAALELGQAAEHGQHQPPVYRRRVDGAAEICTVSPRVISILLHGGPTTIPIATAGIPRFSSIGFALRPGRRHCVTRPHRTLRGDRFDERNYRPGELRLRPG
jgi:hypothetical protein